MIALAFSAYFYRFSLSLVYTMAEMKDYFKYIEDSIQFYTIDEARDTILKYFNPHLSIADMEQIITSYKSEDTVSKQKEIDNADGYIGVVN
jgi:hypothetical protein